MNLGRISSAVLLFMLMQGGAHGQAEVAEHDLSTWAHVIERGDSSEIASALAEVARATERKEDIPALLGGTTFDGNRWNDLHYSCAARRVARSDRKTLGPPKPLVPDVREPARERAPGPRP